MQAEIPPTRVSLNRLDTCLRACVRMTELPGTVGPRWAVQGNLAGHFGRLLLMQLPPTPRGLRLRVQLEAFFICRR